MIERDQKRLQQSGWSERDIRTVGLILKHYCSDDGATIEAKLRAMGLTPTPPLLRQARVQIRRARAEAQGPAATFLAAEAHSPFDPVGQLLAMSSKRTLPIGQVAVDPLPPMGSPSEAGAAVCPFISNDRRRLSVVAEDICDGLVADGIWRASANQQRRIVNSFVWIIGDNAIGDHRQNYASGFKRSLQQLPITFRWKHADNVFFVSVQASFAAITDEERRNPKTVNCDLSTMSTFQCADLSWQPRRQETTAGGSGNSAGRSKLGAYPDLLDTVRTRRICGVELADIFLDRPVPYIYLRKNSTRGLKRNARKKGRIAIAGEVLRLEFAGYVAALRA